VKGGGERGRVESEGEESENGVIPAPQMPDGRRPVRIQSRFMRATIFSAVFATASVSLSNSNLDANLFFYIKTIKLITENKRK
jgi:hypothetical protein